MLIDSRQTFVINLFFMHYHNSDFIEFERSYISEKSEYL